MSSEKFRVALSGDFRTSDGVPYFEAEAWQALQSAPGVEVRILDRPAIAPITRADVLQYDALVIRRNPVDASILAGAVAGSDGIRLRLLARSGVGYDHIDIDACNRAGVMVAITPEAVARPLASSIMATMLAFSHRLFERDRLTRAGRWSERWNQTGMGLTGRTLGVVGLGGIGQELLRLAAPWKMRHLACAPRPRPERYAGLNVEIVPLESLLAQSDFVALCCPLNESTRGMIDAAALARMPKHAYLINNARGEVVNERDLIAALREGRIAGAAIDVYETEPPAKDHPLFAMDNVIVTSHNIGNSDELNTLSNRSVARAVLALAANTVPAGLVNPAVLEHPRLAGLAR